MGDETWIGSTGWDDEQLFTYPPSRDGGGGESLAKTLYLVGITLYF